MPLLPDSVQKSRYQDHFHDRTVIQPSFSHLMQFGILASFLLTSLQHRQKVYSVLSLVADIRRPIVKPCWACLPAGKEPTEAQQPAPGGEQPAHHDVRCPSLLTDALEICSARTPRAIVNVPFQQPTARKHVINCVSACKQCR